MNKENIKRIDSLDGLRAMSILLVLFSHAFKPTLINFGNLGVRVFFLISSYLIVGILYRDVVKNTFSLKTFYFKRISRTFPAFYIYLIAVYILLKTLNIFNWEQFWRAPIYLANYKSRSDWQFQEWFVGHSWSLAVEEQFYVFISVLFFLFYKKIINQKKLIQILMIVLLVSPILRVSYLYFDFFPKVLKGSVNFNFETVADVLALGSIAALLEQEIISKKWFVFFKNKIYILLMVIFLLMMFNSSLFVQYFGLKIRYFYNLFGISIVNISLTIILLIVLNFSSSRIFNFLNNKIMITIGLWSYSIYLWQQVWLYSWDMPLIVKFLGIVTCSVASYYLIEKPFLSLRYAILKKNEIN